MLKCVQQIIWFVLNGDCPFQDLNSKNVFFVRMPRFSVNIYLNTFCQQEKIYFGMLTLIKHIYIDIKNLLWNDQLAKTSI